MKLHKVLLQFVSETFSKYLLWSILQKTQWPVPFLKHPEQSKAIMETHFLQKLLKVLLNFIDYRTVP